MRQHRVRRRVQFYETDAAGIVHFSWFYRYMEEAEHAMWRDAGMSIHPEASEIGWPRVAASFEFRRALRFEDEFDIVIQVAEITSRTIRYVCTLEKDGERVATGTMTIACVATRPSLRSIEIPSQIRKLLQ
jgi:YbgC/YbaW family acyl-CoA thioester hydrolase